MKTIKYKTINGLLKQCGQMTVEDFFSGMMYHKSKNKYLCFDLEDTERLKAAEKFAEYSIIETDFRRVLFIESVSESNKFNMYAYCIKDDLLPYHNGVYHDSNRGCAVYTDGKILFYSRQYYDEEIHALFNIDGNYFTIAKIRKISLAMRDFGFEELAIPDDVKAGNPTLFTSEDSGVVVMPVVPMDYENDKSYYVVKL